LLSILFNYGIYKSFSKIKMVHLRRGVLFAGLFINLGVLFYFKYFDFFISNINGLFKTDFGLKNLLLPLGISFFTFQQISFLIDAYREEVYDCNFRTYALFVSFFPQLIAGPIVTHDEMIPQFMDDKKKQMNWNNLSQGLYMFALGMSKKVLVADIFGKAAGWGFSNYTQLDTTNAILAVLSYTIQIYFDFSGYCDMAIGIGKMLNIELPLNFDSPYKSLTILEFWERWHITLTRFFTKYIYIPLGGNRKGKVRTYFNIMIVFFVSGLWHGANWTFILWGVGHGVFSVITRCFKKKFDTFHPALNWMITFSFVNVMWVFFRADSILNALVILKNIVKLEIGKIHTSILDSFFSVELDAILRLLPGRNILDIYPYFFVVLYFLVVVFLLLGSKNSYEKMAVFKPTMKNSIITAGLLLWSILSFSDVSVFLYFNF